MGFNFQLKSKFSISIPFQSLSLSEKEQEENTDILIRSIKKEFIDLSRNENPKLQCTLTNIKENKHLTNFIDDEEYKTKINNSFNIKNDTRYALIENTDSIQRSTLRNSRTRLFSPYKKIKNKDIYSIISKNQIKLADILNLDKSEKIPSLKTLPSF